MNRRVKRELISWTKTMILALVLAGIINNVLIVNAQIPTESMENTIMAGDRVVALRTSYWFDRPERGDIVVFRAPDDFEHETLYVKRVIGVGGDEIYIHDGNVYLNGEAIVEPYIRNTTDGEFGPYNVPVGSYFMMGDNRNNSLDSRMWRDQYVEMHEVLGKVVFRYYKGISVIK